MTAHHYQNKTDEWMTPNWVVQKCFDLLNPNSNSNILMPFDTESSEFVKQAYRAGHKPIYGMRDFVESHIDYECDYIMTNPPYSIKDQVIERCYKYGKPTALVLPIDSLGGVKRHKLFNQYGWPSVYIPEKRIAYMNGYGQKIQKGPCFHSIILLLNVNNSRIYWENEEIHNAICTAC